MSNRICVVALAGVLFAGGTAPALACETAESEPNNTPDTAEPLATGDCFAGTLSENDQDAFVPDLTDGTARLVISAEGAGLLRTDLFSLERNDEGGITAANKVASVSTSVGGGEMDFPVSLAEGDYIMGLSHAGGTIDYTIGLEETPPPEDAVLSEKGAGDRTDENAIAWKIDEVGADKLWRIRFNGSTTDDTTLVLRDIEGESIVAREADRWGRIDLSPYGLDPGEYTLHINADDEAPWRIAVTPVGERRPDREREPNDTSAQAQPLDDVKYVRGRLSDGQDADHYLLNFEDGDRKELRLRGLGLGTVRLCVSSESGKQECHSGPRRTEFEALASSSAAPLLVSVTHDGDDPLDYQLSMRELADVDVETIAEPNRSRADAPVLPASGKAEGRLIGREYDSFILETDEQAIWRINVTASENLDYVTYHGGRFGNFTADSYGRQATLNSLLLPAGKHLFTMRGKKDGVEARYYIEAAKLGTETSNRELEPNNNRTHATLIAPGDTISGVLSSGDGADGYLISPETATPMRVTVEIGEASGLEYEVYPVTGGNFDSNVKPGETYVMERRFEAGESMINFKSNGEGSASYTISVEALDRGEFASRIDREPNNTTQTAGDLPLDGHVIGGYDDYGERARYIKADDYYRLPDSWAGRSLIVTGEPGGGADITIVDQGRNKLKELSVSEDHSGAGSGKLPGQAPVYLRLEGTNSYDLTIWPAGETPPDPSTAELSARIGLDDSMLPLAAHWPGPQPLTGTVEIVNEGGETATATLDMRLSFIGSRAAPENREIEIPAGEKRTVPFKATLPENLPVRRAVSLIVDVKGAGRTATEMVVPVEAGRAPQAVTANRGIPESMLGGVNVAAASMGGKMLVNETRREKDRDDLHLLIDGMVGRESLFRAWVKGSSTDSVVAVGFKQAPVTGVVIYPHPYHARRYPSAAPAHAVVEARINGDWQETWTGDLATGLTEIILPFAAPVETDAVRIGMRNYGAKRLELSEIKVIASPGDDPTDGDGYEIGAFARGGEMLGGTPYLDNANDLIVHDRDQDDVATFKAWEEVPPEFTTAFRFHRRADISRIEWAPAEAGKRRALDTLRVKASSGSLKGPWRDIGALTREDPELVLERPEAARYLRFVADAGDAEENSTPDSVAVGTDIFVYERAPDETYKSVLGFYGHGKPRDLPEIPEPSARRKNTVSPLELETAVSGIVERGELSQAYKLEVPGGNNRIVLAFDPANPILPQVRLDPGKEEGTIMTEPGPEQAAELRNALDITEGHVLRIVETAPGKHRLKFTEPRRSLLVTWDTSASIGSFRPSIMRALDMVSAELDPEMDAIGLLPFGSSTLLGGEWQTGRKPVRTLLRSESENDSSSATDAIMAGLKMLDTRPGARGMLVITDMDDPTIDYRTRKPYDLLMDTGTLLFGGQINGGGLGSGQTLFYQRRRMRGFTRASHGSFMEVANPTQIVDLFETAMGRLRGPKPYTVTAYAYDQAPPEPGKLAVTLASDGDGGGESEDEGDVIKLNPVEIVLDASGSMLQRLPDGRRRITAAKASIRELIESGLPEETPAALRVFGHLQPDSCDTRLVQPLAPISEGGFVDKLEEIQARNLAKTPIADSLRRIAKDLEGVEGEPLVVLLTDGDETCEGDPAATLKTLRENGLEVRVNIVGFAVGAELDETFSNWAKAGGGKYFKADDDDSLGTALEAAVRPEFDVIDSSGETVASATTDGEPFELVPGRYSLVFSGGQTRTAEIKSEQTTTVEISVTPSSS